MDQQSTDSAELRQHAEAASTLLKSVANPVRLMVLCHLAEGEHSVGQLGAYIDIARSALSQHLAVLRRDNLVQTRRDGQTIYYSLQDGAVHELMKCLHRIYCE